MSLPSALSEALELALAGFTSKELARAAERLSGQYRRDYRIARSFLRDRHDLAAYAAYRLPATYAAARAVFEEVRERRPTFQPRTMLDLGAGPGTATWAATDVWPDIESVSLLERDASMLELGKMLAARAPSVALRSADWRTVDLARPWRATRSDLVVAAYAIGEIPGGNRDRTVAAMAPIVGDVCAIIEPGTPRGFAVVAHCEDLLAGAGLATLAPFPAAWSCLQSESDWHHFATRVPRSRRHRETKRAALAHEDEKYCYVVSARRPGVAIAARVIRKPLIRPGHIRLVLCTVHGTQHRVITRSNRAAFRVARHLRWGAAISAEDAPLFGLTD